jgi:hypothetical protein
MTPIVKERRKAGVYLLLWSADYGRRVTRRLFAEEVAIGQLNCESMTGRHSHLKKFTADVPREYAERN